MSAARSFISIVSRSAPTGDGDLDPAVIGQSKWAAPVSAPPFADLSDLDGYGLTGRDRRA
jgi:hypothetical protein